jgi:hypothetical protein
LDPVNKRDRDRLIVLAAEIQRLRTELQEAETELDALIAKDRGEPSAAESFLGGVAAVAGAAAVGSMGAHLISQATIVERIVTALEQAAEPMTAVEVANALGHKNIQTIRSTLSRLADRGRIESVSHGVYRARSAPPAAEGTG